MHTLGAKFRNGCAFFLLVFQVLSFHVHRQAGLEFYGEFILVDGDYFNQAPDKLLVVFGNGGRLFLQERAHIGNAFEVLPVGYQCRSELCHFHGLRR